MEPISKVVKTFRSQGIIVVLPRELRLDISTRVQRLARLDDIEIGGVDLAVLGLVIVLLGDEDTLAEEVLVDLFTVFLGNKHRGGIAARRWFLESVPESEQGAMSKLLQGRCCETFVWA